MKNEHPQISVAMPVHNARPFLDESISSILNQTLQDFEFVIFDDGSSDGSGDRLDDWARKDSRICLFKSERKSGLSESSNFVVSKCQSPLIARMDADDVSHPDRLRQQLKILEKHPEIVAIGTLCDGIDAEGHSVRPRDRWRIVRRSPFIPFPHGSVMLKREAFDAVGGYNNNTNGAEDQDLFLRMTSQGRVATLPDVLYSYRYHQHNSTLLNGKREVAEQQFQNGDEVFALYRLGAMRLWSGHPPMILEPLLNKKLFHWNIPSLITLASAAIGSMSPSALRFLLRSLLHTRDFAAGLVVKDGRPYEWRSE